MISFNFLVLFTFIGCILSIQNFPKYAISFEDIPCNFSWADEIKKIHPVCNIDSQGYVSSEVFLCAGLLKKSLDLCYLLNKHGTADILSKKPNVNKYDSNICSRFRDFFINSSSTNWALEYNQLFSSNSSCYRMCVDIKEKVNPLCRYTMWVTDELYIRNKLVNERPHPVYPSPSILNSDSKMNPMHNNTVKSVLSVKLPMSKNIKVEQFTNETSANKTEFPQYGMNTSNENSTTNLLLNKNLTVTKSNSLKTDSNSVSGPLTKLVPSITQTKSKITMSSIPTTFEGSTKQGQTFDIQAVQSSSIISEIHVTDKETVYASTTVRTTTKEINPSDTVLEKSEIVNNVPPKISTSKAVYSDNVDEATGNEIDNTGEFTNQDDDLDEPEVKEPSADGAPSGSINTVESVEPEHGKIEIDSESTVDQFMKPDESHFFAYFMTMMVLCIIGYLVFHNKQKILALALEGRSRRSRRRPNTSGYRKLDSNLEEAITSSRSSSATNVIY